MERTIQLLEINVDIDADGVYECSFLHACLTMYTSCSILRFSVPRNWALNSIMCSKKMANLAFSWILHYWQKQRSNLYYECSL